MSTLGPVVPPGEEPCRTHLQTMVEKSIAHALRLRARKNCRTTSGELRALLQREFGAAQQD